ncbi:hypothetical protein MUU47_15385 [Scandinavium sp. H11S7]|uniref:Type 1 fimbrial protein n=1 Tax=Scandinavium hiltneri TaxID=2926519 RepID=A0ABT2E3L9_9ENTR|nr:hypothetical protein [Scandinavium hiltneri]MCS2162479.1 hypothetical protein [Scandinavium hiltneri]
MKRFLYLLGIFTLNVQANVPDNAPNVLVMDFSATLKNYTCLFSITGASSASTPVIDNIAANINFGSINFSDLENNGQQSSIDRSLTLEIRGCEDIAPEDPASKQMTLSLVESSTSTCLSYSPQPALSTPEIAPGYKQLTGVQILFALQQGQPWQTLPVTGSAYPNCLAGTEAAFNLKELSERTEGGVPVYSLPMQARLIPVSPWVANSYVMLGSYTVPVQLAITYY